MKKSSALVAVAAAALRGCRGVGLVLCLQVGGAALAQPTVSPVLMNLIRQTVESHPSVRMESAFVRAAKEDVSAADWQRFPTLAAQTSSNTPRLSTQLSLEQPLWTGGRLDAQRDMARAQEALQAAQKREVQYQLASKVVDSWVAMVQADERIRETTRTIEQLDRYKALIRRRVEAQVSPQIEFTLLEWRTFQARVDLQQTRTARTLSRNRLRQLVGREPESDTEWDAEQPLAALALAASDTRQALGLQIDDAIDVHPSVRKARERARVVQYQADIQRAGLGPEVYLRAQYRAGGAAVPGERSVFVGVRYQPGAGLSSLALSRAASERAQGQAFAAETVQRELNEQMRTDLENMASAQMRAEALATAVESSAAVLGSNEKLFVAGKRSWQEVLNTVREGGDNRLALVDARAALLAASYRLQLVRGDMDWQRNAP
ncbi:TolC family protein [Acidovorax sp. Leaf84]|uniref:TolC family protein n=1 Tax=Acidovorax sp. Leaf84 TaxID=1736240 RepID=UPI0012E2A11A|nr:TolC family protein [Acidovorax sp. Leaf84]